VGHVLGERYRIEALLGEGGMGAVFRATHLSLERPVAVKVLHPRLTDDEHVSKRFDREALAVSKLDHPGCVQVIDFGTTPKGMKYLVMQYLDGRELRDLTEVALPLEQAVDFAVQILRALEHAHKRGLVHRDLKPENIFLVTDDEGATVIKLVDFGIVKLVESTGMEKLTRKGMAFGTPTYMSPEQAAGGTIDARTDLYAVGILLYEMLTGMPPFEADEPGILLRMHILADPPPLPETIPAAVSEVVMRLLEKDADDRFQSAREARRALLAAVESPEASAESSEQLVVPRGGGPDAVTDMGGRASGAAGRAVQAPTPSELPEATLPEAAGSEAAGLEAARSVPEEETRAEPVIPVRSGGTVVAGSSSVPVPSPIPVAASAPVPGPFAGPAGPMSPGAAGSVGPGVAPVASGSMASGSMASGSMSHASGQIAYDSMAMSGVHPPVSPGLGVSGAYGAVPVTGGHRRKKGSYNKALLGIVLVLLTWAAIGFVWWSSRDDGRPKPGASTPAPGLYGFTDESDSAGGPDDTKATKPEKKDRP